MTVTVHGMPYRISNDYATDTGQSWAWDKAAPDCPKCGEPLVNEGRDFDVDAVSMDVWHVRCLCCEHAIRIEGL